MNARILRICAPIGLLLVAPGAATAQTDTSVKPNSDPGAGLFQPGPVEFAAEPLRLDSVGLSMQVPVGSQLKATNAGGQQTLAVTGPDRSWLINIRTPQTSNAASTLKEAMDKSIELIRYSVGVTDRGMDKVVDSQARVIEQTESLQVNGQAASRFYISIPTGDADKRVVKGYTFFKPSARQYVVFELIAPAEAFTRVKAVYETVLATAKFADPMQVSAAYAGAVKAGVHLMEQVSEADRIAAMGTDEQLQRLYRPAVSGSASDAEELGYRTLKFWRGKQGEVDPDKKPASWKGADLEEGYLAQLTVRLLDGTNVFDTVARYFMSPNREGESWSVVMVRMDSKGRELGRWQETGARSGNDVRVLVTQPGKPMQPVEPYIQGEGYLSQFESYLLPSLLIHKAVTDGTEAEFGFYTYRSESESISLRRDTVARDSQAGGAWTISTRFRDESKPQRSVYNERGQLIRTELPDGRVWEPIELETLMRLWRNKGLPTKR